MKCSMAFEVFLSGESGPTVWALEGLLGLLPCNGRDKRHGSSRVGDRFSGGLTGSSGMENVDTVEQTRPGAAGGCCLSVRGWDVFAAVPFWLISHLAHIPALSLLSSPHSATAICSDQLACLGGCR